MSVTLRNLALGNGLGAALSHAGGQVYGSEKRFAGAAIGQCAPWLHRGSPAAWDPQ